MENTNHDDTILARWLFNELTEQELADLQQREDFADMQAIVEEMKNLEMPAFSEQDSWEKLQGLLKAEPPKEEVTPTPVIPISGGASTAVKMDEPEIKKEVVSTAAPTEPPAVASHPPTPKLIPIRETPVRSIHRRRWLYAAAAAVALLLVALLWLREPADPTERYTTSISTKVAEQTQTDLPDGSTANLNALTTLAFSETGWSDEREVYLQGEAYFKAKKGKTFHVLSDQGKVRVVGTRFNVYARGNTLEVKCTEGRVQVFNPTGSEKVLVKAGEQVSVVNGKMQRRRGIDFRPKWYDGVTEFKSTLRSRILDEIERQYGVTIMREGLEEKDYTCQFVNDDLEKALNSVSTIMNLKYEVRSDTVWFSPK